MCIFFLFVSNNPIKDGFQIITAFNRDEYFTRPTKPAHFWNDHCISGTDLEPGREGGTWFGVSSNNRIAALSNILELSPDITKKGRGPLVPDFLTTDIDACKYAATIADTANDYNGFNLILLDKRHGSWTVHYCTNKKSESAASAELLQPPNNGVFCWSNSVHDKPWQKVVVGRQRFAEITNDATVPRKEQLKNQLFDLLSDRTSRLPDSQLEAQTPVRLSHPDVMAARSAIYVDLAKNHYGTRTQTVLLIDANGKCEYTEKTLREPIDASNLIWDTSAHTFILNPATSSLNSTTTTRSKC